MFDLEKDRSRIWALGPAIGVLLFFLALAAVTIAHRNTTSYPKDDAGLYSIHHDQCEKPVDRGRIVEVHNTLSNVGYAIAGALVFVCAVSWAGRLLAVNLVMVAITSGAYHATLAEDPQLWDVVGIYAALLSLSTFVSFVHIRAANPLRVNFRIWIGCGLVLAVLSPPLISLISGKAILAVFLPLICMTAVAAVIACICYVTQSLDMFFRTLIACSLFFGFAALGYVIKTVFGWDFTVVFAVLMVVLVIQLALLLGSAGPPASKSTSKIVGYEIVALVVVLGVGIVARLGDGYDLVGDKVIPKWLCSKDHFLQAHAFWHLLGAAALLITYDLVARFNRDFPDGPTDSPLVLPSERMLIFRPS